MKSPFFPRLGALAAALASLVTLPGIGLAQDTTPPVVVKPLSNLTVAAGTTTSVINLKKTFGLTGVTETVVRIATSAKDAAGNPLTIDVELFDKDAPANVANFLSYVTSGRYNQTLVARLVSGFVLQAGGYYLASTSSGSSLEHLPNPASTVPGEHSASHPNARGTLAFALSNGPDTAQSEWFFNLVDNSNLDDTSDGGPFTVFAHVIEADLAKMDTLSALPVYDLNSAFGYPDDPNEPFYTCPANVAAGTTISSVDQLLYLNDVVVVPLVAPSAGADSVLTLKAKSNNPGLVTATITGKKLKLAYVPGKTGTAKIKVLAKDSAGTQTKSQFTVTVQ